jgi:N-acyl-D-amino-acid deacylase
MKQLIPDSAFDGGHKKFLERVSDPDQKAAMAREMKAGLASKARKDFSYAVIASYKHDRSFNGLSIAEAAKKMHGSDSVDNQIETILEIEKNGGASGVFHGMNEDDLKTFMRHPNTMVACDSGLREFGKDVPHPRGYGNNPRVLARYVRELKVLRLEDAIRKMSSLPANTFHFKHRGELKEGNWGDIVVFDPEKVKDTAEYPDPHHYPSGIPYVLVNGVVVLDNNEHTGAKAGQALRNNANAVSN